MIFFLNLYLVIGFSISYILYISICNSRQNNKCPSNINKITFYNYKLHIHHWLVHILLLPISYFIKNNKMYYLYIGLQLGGIFHGIFTYPNWLDIITSTFII